MNTGYVYILINNSMPGIIKIGKTKRDVKKRARELSNTSIPTPFIIAFEIFVQDVDSIEYFVHEILNDFRINPNREFFRYPLNEAIKVICELCKPEKENEDLFVAIDITYKLKEKYGHYIRQDYKSIRLIQTDNRVWLETTIEEDIAGYLKDQTIKRTDLGFIIGGIDDYDHKLFDPNKNVYDNAEIFLEKFDAYSIAMTTDIFTDEAWEDIQRDKKHD